MNIPTGIPRTWNEKPIRWLWAYKDGAGAVIGYDVRYENAQGDKDVIPFFRRNGKGWESGHVEGEPRPLFGLQTIRDGETVYVVEGAKCAAALHSIGLAAVSSPGGSNLTTKADWTPLQYVPSICVLPDNDDAGEKYFEGVFQQLSQLPGSREICIARLPGLPEKGDIVDWLQAKLEEWDGYSEVSGDRRDEIAETLLGVIEEIQEAVTLEQLVGSDADWPEPVALPNELPSVEPFGLTLLPERIRPWIADVAERFQCPVEFAAVGALVALSSVVGRQVAIRPKQRDDWTVVPNLWGMVIGTPGAMKTPALNAVMAPLTALESEAAVEFEEAMKLHEAEAIVQKAVDTQTHKNINKNATSDRKDALKQARSIIDTISKPPECKRFIVNDSTVEKLGELLRGNPFGVLLYRDELSGFFRTLEKQGRENDRAFFLEAWDGKGSYTYDRIGRGTIRIEACCVSMLGTIQPGPLQCLAYQSLKLAQGNDGLLQRFQIAVWPDAKRTWENVDRAPNGDAKTAYESVFKRLSHLEADSIGAHCENENELPFLRFSPDAQNVFDEWRSELESRLKGEDEHPAMIAHLAKYRSLVPSIALLLHLADGQTGEISERYVTQACAWAEFLESHARRVYAAGGANDFDAARRLLSHVRKGRLSTEFRLRDVYRNGWTGLSTTEEAQAAVDVLIDYEYLRFEREPNTGGRPTARYLVHPKLTGGRDG